MHSNATSAGCLEFSLYNVIAVSERFGILHSHKNSPEDSETFSLRLTTKVSNASDVEGVFKSFQLL